MFSDNVCLQNEEMISASESGDVMTVVSLLNSGADVQTEDKVYLSSFCKPCDLFHSSIFMVIL